MLLILFSYKIVIIPANIWRLGDFNEAARYIRLVSDSPEKNLILLDLQLKGVMQPDTHLLKEIFSPQGRHIIFRREAHLWVTPVTYVIMVLLA